LTDTGADGARAAVRGARAAVTDRYLSSSAFPRISASG